MFEDTDIPYSPKLHEDLCCSSYKIQADIFVYMQVNTIITYSLLCEMNVVNGKSYNPMLEALNWNLAELQILGKPHKHSLLDCPSLQQRSWLSSNSFGLDWKLFVV